MADILSQEELDALLSQMKEEPSEEAVETDGSDAIEHAPLAQQSSSASASNLDMLLALPVEVRVELGRARVSIAEILGFCQGSVVELNNPAGDLIHLTMNDRVVALGEAVVVNENFGIRISEVDSVRERIAKL